MRLSPPLAVVSCLLLLFLVGGTQAKIITSGARETSLDLVVTGDREGRFLFEGSVKASWNATGFYRNGELAGGGSGNGTVINGTIDAPDIWLDEAQQYSDPQAVMFSLDADDGEIDFQGNTLRNVAMVAGAAETLDLGVGGTVVMRLDADPPYSSYGAEVQLEAPIDMRGNYIRNIQWWDRDTLTLTGAYTGALPATVRVRSISGLCFARFEAFSAPITLTASTTLTIPGLFSVCLPGLQLPQPYGLVVNGAPVAGTYTVTGDANGDVTFYANAAGGSFTSGQTLEISPGTIIAMFGPSGGPARSVGRNPTLDPEDD